MSFEQAASSQTDARLRLFVALAGRILAEQHRSREPDIASLALFTGGSANQQLLAAVRLTGHPELRNAHGNLIQHIITASKPGGELAALLGVTQQAVSKTTLELESVGYVSREVDREDTRVRRSALTSRGRAAVERARAARAKLEAAGTSVAAGPCRWKT